MGYLIKNITNLLNINNKNYSLNLNIKGKILKPNEELYYNIKEIDFTIKKLKNLKYITYKYVNDYIEEKDYNFIYGQNNLKDITVIIPTYNNKDYIDECILSIKESKITDYKINIIIGVDNCENTKNYIINNDLYNDINIYYFNKNVGPYIVKNTLVNLSKTENIIFFDSDDIIYDNLIQYINYYLSSEINMINFKYLDFGNTIKHNTSNYAEGVIGIKKNIFLSQNGYYPWKCAADTEFRERYEYNYGKTLKINNVLFKRRIHSENLTKKEDTGMKSDLRRFYKNLISNFRKDNYPNPDKLYTEEDHIKL
jgi:glycosyltransferase involved in cell wall biosynthesis